MTRNTRPHQDEVELSLFGPGIGESVVLHLGNNSWIVVDSCLDQDGRPVALSYLEAMGIDIPRHVKLVLVTHWHDDHIRGIAEILNEAESAKFACSAALRNKEFFTLIGTNEHIKLVDQTSGIAEFSHVLEILSARGRGRFSPSPDYWACGGMTLISQNVPRKFAVRSLSPSAHTITDCQHHMAKLIPQLNGQIGRVPSVGANDLSVVVLVEVHHHRLLLGADLERGHDVRRGWQAILGAADGALGHAYKVAHHGSDNADLDGIWSDLLVPNCHALITPYARGPAPRPTTADINRIKSRTANVFCTSVPSLKSPPRRKGADKTIHEVAISHRTLSTRPGQIRLRIPIDAKPSGFSLELFDGASRI